MPRFYCPPPLPHNGTYDLPADVAHHATRVLRLHEGDRLEIFDGLGDVHHGKIVQIAGKRVIIGEICAKPADCESSLRIVLAQALSSNEKMDWIIQKATELGVAEIQPLDTERSVARLTVERAARRLDHWRQVVISACEQCGRNRLPVVHAPLDILAWLQCNSSIDSNERAVSTNGAGYGHPHHIITSRQTDIRTAMVTGNAPASIAHQALGGGTEVQGHCLPALSDYGVQPADRFILQPDGAASLQNYGKPPGGVVLLVGAEGGFTATESEYALKCGFLPIRLGARVMRMETAAIAGLAALQTLWGDFA